MAASWSPEERDRFLKSLLDDDDNNEMPLLAESVDEMSPEMVEALTQLRDGDDPPSVLADEAKERGNKHFATALKTKNKMWYKEAAKEYTDGLSLCRAARARDEDERPRELEATLRSNRAACALALKNYGDAKRDCHDALVLDDANVKAFYRLGRACSALRQWDAALAAAEWGLKLDPGNKALLEIARTARTETKAATQRLSRRREEHASYFRAVERLGGRLAPAVSSDLPRLHDGGDFGWPLVLEYPEVNVPSDYVEAVSTDDLVANWLLELFEAPPAWDEAGDYVVANLALYVRQPADKASIFLTEDAYVDYRLGGREHHDADASTLFLDLSPAATFRDLVTHADYAITGPIKIQLRPQTSQAHKLWRTRVSLVPVLDLPDGSRSSPLERKKE